LLNIIGIHLNTLKLHWACPCSGAEPRCGRVEQEAATEGSGAGAMEANAARSRCRG